jgi:hypothetical protein
MRGAKNERDTGCAEVQRSNPMSAHYKPVKTVKLANGKDLEAIDVEEAFDLNRNLSNVCKYILRAGKKDSRERDLEKAIDYLWRERYGEWCPMFADKDNGSLHCGGLHRGSVVFCDSTCKGCGTFIR